MNEPRVRIRLGGNGCAYCPGETLSGECRLESISTGEIRAVEVSVLWYSEGKGDEDLAVHSFQRTELKEGESSDLRSPLRFSTVLPSSPLSYRGLIVKIHWCVRVRVFLARGREVVGQREFELGDVPAVRADSSAALEGEPTRGAAAERPARGNGPAMARAATT